MSGCWLECGGFPSRCDLLQAVNRRIIAEYQIETRSPVFNKCIGLWVLKNSVRIEGF